jgi:hypothetical protein
VRGGIVHSGGFGGLVLSKQRAPGSNRRGGITHVPCKDGGIVRWTCMNGYDGWGSCVRACVVVWWLMGNERVGLGWCLLEGHCAVSRGCCVKDGSGYQRCAYFANAGQLNVLCGEQQVRNNASYLASSSGPCHHEHPSNLTHMNLQRRLGNACISPTLVRVCFHYNASDFRLLLFDHLRQFIRFLRIVEGIDV